MITLELSVAQQTMKEITILQGPWSLIIIRTRIAAAVWQHEDMVPGISRCIFRCSHIQRYVQGSARTSTWWEQDNQRLRPPQRQNLCELPCQVSMWHPPKRVVEEKKKISVMTFWPTATAKTKAYSSKRLEDCQIFCDFWSIGDLS